MVLNSAGILYIVPLFSHYAIWHRKIQLTNQYLTSSVSGTIGKDLPLQSCLAKEPSCIAVKLSPAANMTNGIDKRRAMAGLLIYG